MSVGTYALISLSDIKTTLELGDDKVEYNEKIERLIDDVSALVESFCDRQFKSRDYTSEDHDGDGGVVIYTKHHPINTLTALYDDTDRNFNLTTLLDSTSYVFYPEEGKIQLITSVGSGFSTGFARSVQNIRINYNAGYDVIPFDIRMIVSEIIMKKYQAYASRQMGVTTTTVKGESISISIKDLLPDHREILNKKYVRKDMGGMSA